jgi:hypothetical protein
MQSRRWESTVATARAKKILVERKWQANYRGTTWPNWGLWAQLIRKEQRRFGGFDFKSIAMNGQGMTVHETGSMAFPKPLLQLEHYQESVGLSSFCCSQLSFPSPPPAAVTFRLLCLVKAKWFLTESNLGPLGVCETTGTW